MLLKSLLAKLVLGLALLRRICWPFGALASKQRWLTQIAQEGHMPSPQQSWDRHANSSGCIGCGQCDVVDWQAAWSPSTWLQQFARMPQLVVMHPEIVDALAKQAEAIERVCPMAVDVTLLVRLLEEQQQTTFDAFAVR